MSCVPCGPNTYYIGDLVALTATFTDVDTGLPVDPTAVVITILKPDLSETMPTPTKISTGVYEVEVTIDESGVWKWKAVGTGAAVAANPTGQFSVEPDPF